MLVNKVLTSVAPPLGATVGLVSYFTQFLAQLERPLVIENNIY